MSHRESTWKETGMETKRQRDTETDKETQRQRETERHTDLLASGSNDRASSTLQSVLRCETSGLFIKYFEDFYTTHYRNYIQSHSSESFPPYKFIFEWKDGTFRPLKTVTAPASHVLAWDALSHLSAAVASGVTCSVEAQSHRFLLLLQFITMVWESHDGLGCSFTQLLLLLNTF